MDLRDVVAGKYPDYRWIGPEPERVWHLCEQCGRRELLTPQEAYDAGWDYPPRMGMFGIVGQRNCPRCLLHKSLWGRLVLEKSADLHHLCPHDLDALGRILMEPESLRDGRQCYYYMTRIVDHATVVAAIDASGKPWKCAGIMACRNGEPKEETWYDGLISTMG